MMILKLLIEEQKMNMVFTTEKGCLPQIAMFKLYRQDYVV